MRPISKKRLRISGLSRLRYFVISDSDGPVALVTHDYRKGSYICRSKLESFAQVFDAQADKQATRFVREAKSLRLKEYSASESEWIDSLLESVLACNTQWFIEHEGESSGSDLTVDDLVAEYLVD